MFTVTKRICLVTDNDMTAEARRPDRKEQQDSPMLTNSFSFCSITGRDRSGLGDHAFGVRAAVSPW